MCANRREAPSTGGGITGAVTVERGGSDVTADDAAAVFCALAVVCANRREVPSGVGACAARSIARCFSISRHSACARSCSMSLLASMTRRREEEREGEEER